MPMKQINSVFRNRLANRITRKIETLRAQIVELEQVRHDLVKPVIEPMPERKVERGYVKVNFLCGKDRPAPKHFEDGALDDEAILRYLNKRLYAELYKRKRKGTRSYRKQAAYWHNRGA